MQFNEKEKTRFEVKIEKTDTCWNWKGYLTRGYGRFYLNGKDVPAHRVSYEFMVGPIPEGLVIDHLCFNKACVNPKHLEPVTQGENTRRSISTTSVNKLKVDCKNGHLLSGENVYWYHGYRQCRPCMRQNCKAFYYRKKTARSID